MTRPGRDIVGEAKTELDHFGNCPICRALVDMRDLAQVMEHVHGQEIERVERTAAHSIHSHSERGSRINPQRAHSA